MSEPELIRLLVTCDGRGKEAKEKALRDLLAELAALRAQIASQVPASGGPM